MRLKFSVYDTESQTLSLRLYPRERRRKTLQKKTVHDRMPAFAPSFRVLPSGLSCCLPTVVLLTNLQQKSPRVRCGGTKDV